MALIPSVKNIVNSIVKLFCSFSVFLPVSTLNSYHVPISLQVLSRNIYRGQQGKNQSIKFSNARNITCSVHLNIFLRS